MAKQLTRVVYGLEDARELERWLIEGVREKKEGAACRLTVQELFDEYIHAKRCEDRGTTVRGLMARFGKHTKGLLGGVRLDRLTVPVLQKWKLAVGK